MKPRVQIQRSQMLMWASGILIDFAKGRGIAVNELACRTAEQAMDRHETIYLLSEDGRKVVSTMRLTKAGYQERRQLAVGSARSPCPAEPATPVSSRHTRVRRNSNQRRKRPR